MTTPDPQLNAPEFGYPDPNPCPTCTNGFPPPNIFQGCNGASEPTRLSAGLLTWLVRNLAHFCDKGGRVWDRGNCDDLVAAGFELYDTDQILSY